MFKFRQERLDLYHPLENGKIFPYQKDPQDMRWVVKRVLAENINDLLGRFSEIVLGFNCDHPCIVPIKGYFVEKLPNSESFYVYTKIPRMKETLATNLKARKTNSKPFPEKEIIQHFYSITCGLKYLHGKKFYHGDIRHDNLSFDENGNLKIANVGIVKHVEDKDLTYYSSAPEIFGASPKKDQLFKADVWSLGVVILELCALDSQLLDASLPQDKLQSKLDELFGSLEGKYQKELIILIKKLLSLDPAERPDIVQIKDYLEKNFRESLNKDLLDYESPRLADSESKISVLSQDKKDPSEAPTAERNQLQELISQFQLHLVQQKQQNDRAEILLNQEAKHQKMSETLAHLNEKLKSYEEQIQSLQQEKTSSEQNNTELERYIETTVKDQMKAYEDRIKDLQESQEQEKIKFDQERNRLLKEIGTLQLKVKGLETFKAQVNRENYDKNLEKAVLQLEAKFSQWFDFKVDNKHLIISPSSKSKSFLEGYKLTDEKVEKLSEGITATLEENNLFNLIGLEFSLSNSFKLTGKSLAHVARLISNPSLELQHLVLKFTNCRKMTSKSLARMTTAISNPSLQLQHLTFAFGNLPKLTNADIKIVATTIEKSCKNLQELNFDFSSSGQWSNQITEFQKKILKNQFAHVPKVESK